MGAIIGCRTGSKRDHQPFGDYCRVSYDQAGNASKSKNGKSMPRRRDAVDATTMRLLFRVAGSQVAG
ncbi:hypothetical protein E4U30_000337 [Claviceps sp. LM220 group G6]|nr:hypothetical protein E4U30_000337 [Claviceps sp. LM220 group G6]KAG6107523.1 hypothetical protein E4U14_004105 [Claviceps sp. LM454 group G7]